MLMKLEFFDEPDYNYLRNLFVQYRRSLKDKKTKDKCKK